jgi:hypothetical protein
MFRAPDLLSSSGKEDEQRSQKILCQCGRYLVPAGRPWHKCYLGTSVTSSLPSPKVFTKRVWNLNTEVLFLQLCAPSNCWRLVVSVDCWVVGDKAVNFAHGFVAGETSDWIVKEALPRISLDGKCKTHTERSTSSLTALGRFCVQSLSYARGTQTPIRDSLLRRPNNLQNE